MVNSSLGSQRSPKFIGNKQNFSLSNLVYLLYSIRCNSSFRLSGSLSFGGRLVQNMGEKLGFLLCVWFKLWGFLWEGLWRRKQVEGDFTESLKGVYECVQLEILEFLSMSEPWKKGV
jgi:hypothetical protein